MNSLVIEPFSDKSYAYWLTTKTFSDDPEFITKLVHDKQRAINQSYLDQISVIKTALLNPRLTKEKLDRLTYTLSLLEHNLMELRHQW